MSFISRAFLPLLFSIPMSMLGQDQFTAYFQPQIALNYSVKDDYSHNFSVQQRSFVYDDNQIDVKARQLDVTHFSKLKIAGNKSLALGIQYRFRNGIEANKGDELRLTQQYSSTFKPFKVRYGHRLRSEQRIVTNFTTYRLRYRFAFD